MKLPAKYPFQERVAEFTRQHNQVGICVFYGGGKTYLALRWLEEYAKLPALVLMPGRLIPQWGAEIEKFTAFTYNPIEGQREQRLERLELDADIFLVGYGSIRSATVYNKLRLRRRNFQTVIADESTQLKTQRTQRFLRLYDLCRQIPYRALLTGRPIEEFPEDVFAQMQFLDLGATFGESFWKFRQKYFYPHAYLPQWTLWPNSKKLIAEKMRRKCIFVRQEDVLTELPPKEYNRIEFKLPEKVRRYYDELRKQFRAEIDGVEVNTIWAAAVAMKLHEIATGFIYDDSGETRILHRLKTEWLEENLPEMLQQGPVLIWNTFRAGMQLAIEACENINIAYATDDSEGTKAFKAGEVDVLLLSQDRSSAGGDYWRARHAVFFSCSSKAASRTNAEARCYRIGSEIHDRVTYWDLVCKGTADVRILNIIQRKKKMIDEILEHLRE